MRVDKIKLIAAASLCGVLLAGGYAHADTTPVTETAVTAVTEYAYMDTNSDPILLHSDASDTAPLPPPTLQARQVNGILFITGGIGEKEKQTLEEARSQYNLWVMNSDHDGGFLGDEHLSLTDKTGQEILSTDIGPLFYASLPEGKYTLSLTFNGVTQSKKIVIDRKTTNLHFVWQA